MRINGLKCVAFQDNMHFCPNTAGYMIEGMAYCKGHFDILFQTIISSPSFLYEIRRVLHLSYREVQKECKRRGLHCTGQYEFLIQHLIEGIRLAQD